MNETTLDPQVVNMAKAIRQAETGNVVKPGATGEIPSRYQFLPGTWKNYAREILGDENAPITLENENKVAYTKIKQWKDAGMNIGQVASMWNAGEGRPDAYKQNWRKVDENGKVLFDTPAYAKKVATYYQKFKAENPQIPEINQNETPVTEEPKKEGLLTSIFRGITQPPVTMLARPVQAVAQLAGASNEDINKASAQIPFYGENGNLDMPTGTFNDTSGIKDLGKAAGQGLQTVALGMPVGTVPKAIGMGTTMGLGSGLEQDPSNLGGIAANTAIGAVSGLIGGGLSKGLAWLPKSLTKGAFPKATEQDISRLLTTKTAAPTKQLLQQNTKALNDIGSKMTNIIKAVPNKQIYTAQDVLNNAAKQPTIGKQIQEMGINLKEAQKLLKQTSTKTGLVDDLFNKGLSLDDLWTLNSSLGKKVYKLDTPLVTKSKQFSNLIYGPTTNLIQSTDSRLPALFSEYGKERVLTDLLNTAAKKSGQMPLLTYNDIISIFAGSSMGGPLGGVGGYLASKVMNRPSGLFGAAKVIQGANKLTTPILNRSGLLPSLIKQSHPTSVK